MNKPLNVLVFEGSKDEVRQLLNELQLGGYDTTYERVETISAMKTALDRQGWDIVIANYSSTHSKSLAALKLLRENETNPPCIIVSSFYGEDNAVEAMQAGAADYIMKKNTSKIIPAIESVLNPETRRSSNNNGYINELKKLRTIINNINDLAYMCDTKGNIIYINRVFEDLTGHTTEEFTGKPFAPLFDKENLKKAVDFYTKTLKGSIQKEELRFKKTGILCDYRNIPLKNKEGEITGLIGIARDITERKEMERKLMISQANLKKINKTLDLKVEERTQELMKINREYLLEIKRRKKANDTVRRQMQLAMLESEIGNILVNNYDLKIMLKRCTDTIVKTMKAAFARIWTLNEEDNMLELQASSGMYTHIDGPHNRVPSGTLKIGLIAKECRPYLINDIQKDPHIIEKDWAKREGIVAFTGYPLVIDKRIVGVIALFSREKIPKHVTHVLASISTKIALGLERKRTESKLSIYHEKLKSLASELSSTEEQERRKIAEDLHDHVGQTLIASKINLERLLSSSSFTEHNHIIEETIDLISKTIQEIRTMTFEISPPVLFELGLEHALEWLIEKYQKYGITFDFAVDNQPKPLDDNIRITLFRAICELFFNIVKHAMASKVKLSIKEENNNIRIDITDNGSGLDFRDTHLSTGNISGFGLFSIKERLDYLGGKLWIGSAPNRGTTVILTAPLKDMKEKTA